MPVRKPAKKPAKKQRGGAGDLAPYVARNDLANKIQQMTLLNSLPKSRQAKQAELQRTDAALRTRDIDDAMMAKAKDLCQTLQQLQKLANAYIVAPADVQATTSDVVLDAVSAFGAKFASLSTAPGPSPQTSPIEAELAVEAASVPPWTEDDKLASAAAAAAEEMRAQQPDADLAFTATGELDTEPELESTSELIKGGARRRRRKTAGRPAKK